MAPESSSPDPTSYLSTALFIVAGLVLVLFIIAAVMVNNGGSEIAQIESVGGKTLEEAYYTRLGTIYASQATAYVATGLAFSGILTALGFKLKG